MFSELLQTLNRCRQNWNSI